MSKTIEPDAQPAPQVCVKCGHDKVEGNVFCQYFYDNNIRRNYCMCRCVFPPAPQPCPDCDEAKRLAYSDATTPGFMFDKCEKHRAAPEQKPRSMTLDELQAANRESERITADDLNIHVGGGCDDFELDELAAAPAVAPQSDEPPERIWIDPDAFSGEGDRRHGSWHANNDHDLVPSEAIPYARVRPEGDSVTEVQRQCGHMAMALLQNNFDEARAVAMQIKIDFDKDGPYVAARPSVEEQEK